MLTGSLSTEDMIKFMPLSFGLNDSTKCFKYPRSELLCSHNITLTFLWLASNRSWCDISPVIYRSALTPLRTLDPDPAQTATVDIEDSENNK